MQTRLCVHVWASALNASSIVKHKPSSSCPSSPPSQESNLQRSHNSSLFIRSTQITHIGIDPKRMVATALWRAIVCRPPPLLSLSVPPYASPLSQQASSKSQQPQVFPSLLHVCIGMASRNRICGFLWCVSVHTPGLGPYSTICNYRSSIQLSRSGCTRKPLCPPLARKGVHMARWCVYGFFSQLRVDTAWRILQTM